MRMLLPLLLLLIGSAAGVAAGIYFRPAADTGPAASQTSDPTVTMPENGGKGVKDDSGAVEYVKLSNQFVVPIVKGGNVASLVVLALSMEVPAGLKETIYRHEPKLRDSFLQVLFDHANVGGFDGAFTQATMLSQLRAALREVAQRDIGKDQVNDVLITEIARQDY
ncbi:flagellar basal body-associated FliL family protein [Sulfitobacter sp. TSTF-M16]|uniref:Flagellar protein FliL n=1 Tax=Sulfitobacter aestuariivivens TaxID=2766981 RepID=A0A927D5P9_9RHOB|nr:flagellar basal body-associated FliL family protein [Sulfitobacter aestuariivivens]MBD3665510.1 flagellar basal body-associated FliL family protein [Sulfitobacter aestuariivivens]